MKLHSRVRGFTVVSPRPKNQEEKCRIDKFLEQLYRSGKEEGKSRKERERRGRGGDEKRGMEAENGKKDTKERELVRTNGTKGKAKTKGKEKGEEK